MSLLSVTAGLEKPPQIQNVMSRLSLMGLPEVRIEEVPPPETPKSPTSTYRFEERLVGNITEQHLKEIAQELGLIKLCWTDVLPIDYDERVHYAWSYSHNSKKEKLLLWYSENFRRQYTQKFPKRRPLLLACENECRIQKMVCTTLRPTTIRYPEFQTWQGCAIFVADHLKYEPLQSETVLPDRINSPHEVLKRQAGHCFEYSILLASFLISAAYDAYVVSGYATREICLNDNSRTECPYLPDEVEVEEVAEVEEEKKYFLRAPKDLRSQFLLEMEAREIQKEKDAQKAQELAELAAIKEFEKPKPDKLWSWRLHSWVLILPSKDIVEPCFIESVTGVMKSVGDTQYHGIESVWNHLNYWVLVQFPGKTISCEDINFDLADGNCWEHVLIGEPFTTRLPPPELADAEPEELEKEAVLAEKHLDMPASWVSKLEIPHSVFEQRYPNSKKIIHYRKCIAELYAPYVQEDGLLERVTRYNDYEYQEVIDIKESYEHRADLMYFCHKSMEDQAVRERFHRGREDAMKEHYFYSSDSGIECRFSLEFYDEARLDGLSELVMDPLYMTEHYKKRIDFLYYRHVDFKERDNPEAPRRVIKKITEKYFRNSEIRADLNVAMVEYFFPERKVCLKFHYEPEHVTQATREFLKPAPTEMELLVFDPSLTSGYLTGPTRPQPKPLYLYRLETKCFADEEVAVKKVREREDELISLLRLRTQELAVPNLLVSVFDEERNQAAKEGYKERERKIREARERDMDLVCDFLAPYYAKIGNKGDEPLSLKTAQKMVSDCLQEWKNLLVMRANDIQQQFEQTSQDLHDKNNWYEQNQGSLTKEQEEEYFDYCKRNTFLLHSLEVRLNRHRDLAPQRYLAMDAYLRGDTRLALLYFKQTAPTKKRRIRPTQDQSSTMLTT